MLMKQVERSAVHDGYYDFTYHARGVHAFAIAGSLRANPSVRAVMIDAVGRASLATPPPQTRAP